MKNRERKYRAYNPNTKQIIYSHELDLPTFFKALELAPNAIVEDWTGLQDKDGKEIYEGDIVRYENRIWIVEFDNGAFALSDPNDNEDGYFLFQECTKDRQVIGNINKNPELL